MKPTPEYISIAREMKSLGFPQPEFSAGQMWSMTHDSAICVLKAEGDGVEFRVNEYGKPLFIFKEQLRHLVYLPTVEDVLEELGGDFALSFFSGEWWCMKDSGGFYESEISHESAVVACAMAWLKVKKTCK